MFPLTLQAKAEGRRGGCRGPGYRGRIRPPTSRRALGVPSPVLSARGIGAPVASLGAPRSRSCRGRTAPPGTSRGRWRGRGRQAEPGQSRAAVVSLPVPARLRLRTRRGHRGRMSQARVRAPRLEHLGDAAAAAAIGRAESQHPCPSGLRVGHRERGRPGQGDGVSAAAKKDKRNVVGRGVAFEGKFGAWLLTDSSRRSRQEEDGGEGGDGLPGASPPAGDPDGANHTAAHDPWELCRPCPPAVPRAASGIRPSPPGPQPSCPSPWLQSYTSKAGMARTQNPSREQSTASRRSASAEGQREKADTPTRLSPRPPDPLSRAGGSPSLLSQ